MTKRERVALQRRIDKAIAKVARKRDELRAALSDIEGIVESVRNAEEPLSEALDALTRARRAVDDAADELSKYV